MRSATVKSWLRCLPVAMGLIASWAQAEEGSPNNVVGIGEYWVFYHVHATDISGPFTPPGLNLDVKNTNTPYLAYFRRLHGNFWVELTGGIPPVTKTVGKGPAELGSVPYNGQVITTARWLAPSLLLKYEFLDERYIVRPYLEAGVNYVMFYDRDSTPAGNAGAGGPTRIELPSSVGPAGTAGVALHLPRNLGMTASWSFSRVQTHLTAITGDVQRSSSIGFNPQTLVVAVTYAF